MKFSQNTFLLTLIVICGMFLQMSCAKDADLLSSYVINDVVESSDNSKPTNTIILPSDFDWQNIPPEYANSVLEINEVFDLQNELVELPMNVTLYFNEGHIENGTVEGDSTVITTEARDPIAEDVTFTGTYGNEYVMPYWFGAVMDGVTDDREAFVETLAYADSLSLKVLVDRDMFLDVEETGKKSIFLEDNTWIEGANDARIIVNNLLSPAFYLALTKDVTIKNITFLYDQIYIANYGENFLGFNNDFLLNLQQLRDYLRDYKDISFNGVFPKDKGFVAFYAMFLLEAAEDVIFENVKFVAKGNSADTFIPFIMKMKEQYGANQTVSSNSAPTSISRNIILNNITVDGAIMGFQGVVDGFHVDNVISYRYSDFQDVNGNYLGGFDGENYDFPPPHLFYLNRDSYDYSSNFTTNNVDIRNVYDYGNYIGTSAVRGSTGINIGYANSLKLTQQPENIYVENYKSYRRDGLGSFDGVINGHFKNIYAESNIGIFNPLAKVSTLRLLFDHPLENVILEDVTLIDIGESTEVMPIRPAYGSNVYLDNVKIYVKEFKGASTATFGFFGNNNTIINSSVHIDNHISTQTNRGIIFHDSPTMEDGANNYYDIQVHGWRNIDSDPFGLGCRMLFAKPVNTNSNYARLEDISNNINYEQTDNLNIVSWIKSDTINLGAGKSYTSVMQLPQGFAIKRIMIELLSPLDGNVNSISMGMGNGLVDNLMTSRAISVNTPITITNNVNDIFPLTSNTIYTIYSGNNFNNKGTLKIDFELIAETTN
ncbi:hypothetical protein PXD56_02780 [Maribacter sp. SA7]|uniref:hypothetical protein n=1 Tax=Maribacter zhoushanensis TaxID=3030012 RepID=UPI0023EB76D9|nr:hypothetical protein [Maribacter zhoushanensis]MDF4201863.1 hypothetical protein [Maribacter zhoushanensis]